MSLSNEEKQRIEEEEAYRAEVRGRTEVPVKRSGGKYEAIGFVLILAGFGALFVSGAWAGR